MMALVVEGMLSGTTQVEIRSDHRGKEPGIFPKSLQKSAPIYRNSLIFFVGRFETYSTTAI